ncbi:MAG: hypothetical protein IKR18_01620 [Bacteroidaceae bacterium]|nr:hypothetical protein [Bacteroidaceae bacterium]
MKYIILILICLLCGCSAQQLTVYYDGSWIECDRNVGTNGFIEYSQKSDITDTIVIEKGIYKEITENFNKRKNVKNSKELPSLCVSLDDSVFCIYPDRRASDSEDDKINKFVMIISGFADAYSYFEPGLKNYEQIKAKYGLPAVKNMKSPRMPQKEYTKILILPSEK